jgi:hypothetical protein
MSEIHVLQVDAVSESRAPYLNAAWVDLYSGISKNRAQSVRGNRSIGRPCPEPFRVNLVAVCHV